MDGWMDGKIERQKDIWLEVVQYDEEKKRKKEG